MVKVDEYAIGDLIYAVRWDPATNAEQVDVIADARGKGRETLSPQQRAKLAKAEIDPQARNAWLLSHGRPVAGCDVTVLGHVGTYRVIEVLDLAWCDGCPRSNVPVVDGIGRVARHKVAIAGRGDVDCGDYPVV